MTGEPIIDHVTLWVGDLPASRRFYEAALAPLGFGLKFEHDGVSWPSEVGRAGGSSYTRASGPS